MYKVLVLQGSESDALPNELHYRVLSCNFMVDCNSQKRIWRGYSSCKFKYWPPTAEGIFLQVWRNCFKFQNYHLWRKFRKYPRYKYETLARWGGEHRLRTFFLNYDRTVPAMQQTSVRSRVWRNAMALAACKCDLDPLTCFDLVWLKVRTPTTLGCLQSDDSGGQGVFKT